MAGRPVLGLALLSKADFCLDASKKEQSKGLAPSVQVRGRDFLLPHITLPDRSGATAGRFPASLAPGNQVNPYCVIFNLEANGTE